MKTILVKNHKTGKLLFQRLLIFPFMLEKLISRKICMTGNQQNCKQTADSSTFNIFRSPMSFGKFVNSSKLHTKLNPYQRLLITFWIHVDPWMTKTYTKDLQLWNLGVPDFQTHMDTQQLLLQWHLNITTSTKKRPCT